MVSDVRLSPTSTPQGNTFAVPTIRPADTPGPSLRAIPRVSPSGFEQAQRAYALIGQQASRTGAKIVAYADQRRREEEAREHEEEDLRNRDLEAQRVILQQNIEMGNLAGIQTDLGNSLNRITTQSGGDPAYIAQAYGAVVEETAAEMPPDVAGYVKTTAAARANPVLEHARARQAQAAAIEAQGEQAAYQDFLQEEAVQYANAKTPDEATARDSAITQYNDLIEARTDLTPGEKELKKRELFEDMNIRVGLDYVLDSGNPAATAARVALGATGIPDIDNMPSTERIKVFQQAQGIVNYFQAERSRAESAAQDRQDAVNAERIIKAYRLAQEAPEEAEALSDLILNSATDPTQARQAISLKEVLRTEQRRPYQESDPALVGAFDLAIGTGIMPANELRGMVIDKFGDGVGSADLNRLLDNIEAQQEGLLASNAYNTIQIQAQTVFPEVLLPSTGNAIADFFNNPDSFTASASPEVNQQRRLYAAFLTDLRQKAQGGAFATEADMQEYANKELTRYSNMIGTSLPKVKNSERTDVRDYNASLLNETERNAYVRAVQDKKAVEVVNQKYIKNPAQIGADYNAGLITQEQARKYQALLMPVFREAK